MTVTGDESKTIEWKSYDPIPTPEEYINPIPIQDFGSTILKRTLIFDAGHGIEDGNSGKTSPNGILNEGKYVREIVDYLIKACRAAGFTCINLVENDEDIVLRERVDTVNTKIFPTDFYQKSCLLISIHLNASGLPGTWNEASGWTVWIPETTPAPFSSRGDYQTRVAEQVAKGMLAEAKKFKIAKYNKVLRHDFDMLKWCRVPAIMTGNMFLDNEEDLRFLLSAEGKRKIVQIHLNGILAAFGSPVRLDYEKYKSGTDISDTFEQLFTKPFTLNCLGLQDIQSGIDGEDIYDDEEGFSYEEEVDNVVEDGTGDSYGEEDDDINDDTEEPVGPVPETEDSNSAEQDDPGYEDSGDRYENN